MRKLLKTAGLIVTWLILTVLCGVVSALIAEIAMPMQAVGDGIGVGLVGIGGLIAGAFGSMVFLIWLSDKITRHRKASLPIEPRAMASAQAQDAR